MNYDPDNPDGIFQFIDEAVVCKELNRLRTKKAISFEGLRLSGSVNSNQAV